MSRGHLHSPFGHIIRYELLEHSQLLRVHGQLRVQYLRAQQQRLVKPLLGAAMYDGEVGYARIGRDDRRRRYSTVLLHVNPRPASTTCTPTFPTTHALPNTAPTSTTVPSPTSAASTTAFDSTTTFFPNTVPSLRSDALLRADAMLLRRLSASSSAPMPTPTLARSYTTTPSPSTTGASALLILLCGCRIVFGPSVIGCVPVSWACCAMTTEGSSAIDEGRGSMDMRFGAVEERRSGAGRGTGCDDMVVLMGDGAWWVGRGFGNAWDAQGRRWA
jgi:hypothetical protein